MNKNRAYQQKNFLTNTCFKIKYRYLMNKNRACLEKTIKIEHKYNKNQGCLEKIFLIEYRHLKQACLRKIFEKLNINVV